MILLHLLLFFGIVTSLLNWLSPISWQRWIILIGGILFLYFQAPISLVILTVTTISSYGIFQTKLKTAQATILILFQNLALFALYKLGWASEIISPMDRLIPLGLSFYAFRQIHYAIEKYKGKLAEHDFWDYALYMFFLPTILIGPIHRFQNFLRDSYRRRWDQSLFSEGLERILYGYAKVVVLGNFIINFGLGQIISSLPEKQEWLIAYLKIFSFTINTYFQFAGYSDVAIGLALLLGYRVMENFNYPFFAPNINDFWNRWHISLSSWCRDYVYTPMASMTRKPIVGILLTMLVIGLWHEISWKYVIWGGFHGIGIAIWHFFHTSKFAERLNAIGKAYTFFSILLTFHFVLLSFVIVMENDWKGVLTTYQILFGLT